MARGDENMINENTNQRMKRGAVLLTLLLVAVIPFAALAETSTQSLAAAAGSTTGVTATGKFLGRGGHRYMSGGYGVDLSLFTDEQRAAYDSAISLYEQIEDAVLSDLMAANIVAQADVDAYVALRTAKKSLYELDRTNWTAAQYKAFYEANFKTGDERKAAMQALADAGQLTKDQADALGAQGQSGLWTKIAQNASTNSAIQTAISTMLQARKTLNSSLRDAGIAGVDRGGMFGGFGKGTKDFGQGSNKNSDSNRPQGGKGGRK